MSAPWHDLARVGLPDGLPNSQDTLAASLSVATAGAMARGGEEALRRGATIGRYLVLTRLGSGGMGVVYAAYDPELDRKVAVKLLKPGEHDPRGRARLLREAQALAKLSHPNVVAVHDVGTVGEQVFVAMEFVQGVTLGKRLGERRYGWEEVVEIFTAIGRGLSAAHAAGLVHRDLKPDNVMVGADGRVRVMDFGLAHADGRELVAVSQAPARAEPGPFSLDLTPRGALLGTPRYMSPEQWLGQPVDARSDQFSLCVALWEALFGARPFAGGHWAALRAAVLAGRLGEPEDPGRAPVWLRRVVERGLQVAPEGRYPSVEALLAAIGSGQARSRRRRLLGAAAVALGLGGVALGGARWGHAQRIAGCEAEGAAVREELWPPATQAAMREVFTGSGLSFAAATYDEVVPRVEGWLDGWAAARSRSCVDALVHEVRPIEVHARAVACLDEEREEARAILESVVSGETYVVRSALRALDKLPKIEECTDESKLRRRDPLPDDPRRRAQVLALRRDLTAVERLRYGGRYREGLERIVPGLVVAEALGYAALEAQMRLQAGLLAIEAGRYAMAEEELTRAFTAAGELGNDELAMSAAMELAFLIGNRLGRTGEALAWARTADMLVRRLGEEASLPGASVASNTALVYRASGDLEAARTLLARALAIREARFKSPDHPTVAGTLANLADVHAGRGDLEQAATLHRRALAIRERGLGPEHPRVALSLHGLAQVQRARGELDAAAAGFERALAIWEATLGPEHPDVGAALVGLGEVALDRGRIGEALELFRRAEPIWRGGQVRPDEVAQLRFGLARALWYAPTELGRDPAEARALAAAAAAALRGLGPGMQGRAAEIEAWLASRRE